MKLNEIALHKMFLNQEYNDHMAETEPWGNVMKTLPIGSKYLYDIFTDPSEDYRAGQPGDYNHPEFRVWQSPKGTLIVLDMLEWEVDLDKDTLEYFELLVPRSELEKHLVPFVGTLHQVSGTLQ